MRLASHHLIDETKKNYIIQHISKNNSKLPVVRMFSNQSFFGRKFGLDMVNEFQTSPAVYPVVIHDAGDALGA